MIQDSHYFRDNRTNTDLFLFDKNIWYFTQSGLVETLKRSHKKNAKAVLKAFEDRMNELFKEQAMQQNSAPFQTVLEELYASTELLGQLEAHKDMLSVQHFLFQGQQFKIYGTKEEPLFLANDIICGLLEMDRPSDNRFFRDNRNQEKYIHLCQFATAPQDVQSRVQNNQNNAVYFFTEKGLYKCLMRSTNPIAEIFQDEICDLLKNIRLGYIELVVTNSQAVSQHIQKCIQDVQGLVDNHSALMVKLGKYTDIVEKSKRTIDLYELKTEDGQVYRGQSNNFRRRVQQHRRSSCSPVIREAYSRGNSVSEQVIRQVEVFNQDDIKYEEAKFIGEVSPSTLLNRVIPKPDMSRVTVNSIDEESKSQDRELDTISEAVTVQEGTLQEEYKKKPDGHLIRNAAIWQQKYDDLVAFVEARGKMPSKHDKDKEQAKLGMWVADQRKAYSGKGVPITAERIQLLEKVKGWKWSKTVQVEPVSSFSDMLANLTVYVREQGKLPAPENVNPKTRALALWIIDIRASNAKNELSDSEKEQLQSVSGWEWVSRDGWYNYFKELQQFVQRTGNLPASDPSDKSQTVLYKWTTAQNTDFCNCRLNSERVALLETITDWSWQSTEDRWLNQYNQVKIHIQNTGKVPTAGPLGKWAGHQREQYANNTLSTDRVELLNELGSAWYWNVKEKLFGK